jgi:cleavage and polyadenylation specificity factor subunit 1
MEPFELPKEDDYHQEWQLEKDLIFKPMVERGILNLVNPSNWSVIHTEELGICETVMCVENLYLEVSESTNERKHLIVVGTAISRGEDLPIRGRVIVYDVVTVIPEPGRPETNKRLKLVAKEDIPRGAVTAISEIGTQGLMLVAQGQKCMVRGLKEDGSLLPVAFMDMSCYVTSVRELKGTGLCLMADAVKGVWFTGYTEDPYKMLVFAKSSTTLEVLTVDFLPDGNELSIMACDSDGGIHILQFDPERKLHRCVTRRFLRK